jgi:hypothetical protein
VTAFDHRRADNGRHAEVTIVSKEKVNRLPKVAAPPAADEKLQIEL